jgi:hypothetical protein
MARRSTLKKNGRPDQGRPIERRRRYGQKGIDVETIPWILSGFPKMPLFVRVTSLFSFLKRTGKDARTPEKP